MAIIDRFPNVSYMFMDSDSACELMNRWREHGGPETDDSAKGSMIELVVIKAMEWNGTLKFARSLREAYPGSEIILVSPLKIPQGDEEIFDSILPKSSSVDDLAQAINRILGSSN